MDPRPSRRADARLSKFALLDLLSQWILGRVVALTRRKTCLMECG